MPSTHIIDIKIAQYQLCSINFLSNFCLCALMNFVCKFYFNTFFNYQTIIKNHENIENILPFNSKLIKY